MESRGTLIPFVLLATLLLSVAASSSAQRNTNDFIECLTTQFHISNSTTGDVIYTPRNASYASLLRAQNLRPASTATRRPELIITPSHESEIQDAIFCSKKLGMQIRVRSGGHDYEGLSYINPVNQVPFVVVDMRNFRSISIDTDEKTTWVQVGATLGQLYYTISQRSTTLGFPAGVCPTVGVGGHFSGGGYGMMARKNGLAIDHIIDAQLINADGQILDRKSMGEDLFWAIRGGGGSSFGIVVAFKVTLVSIPETVTVFNVSRTLEQNVTELVHRYQHIADKVDDNLLITIFTRSVRNPTTGRRTIAVSFLALYLGRANDLMPIMRKSFPELGLVRNDCIEMSWIESVLFIWRLQGQPTNVLVSSVPRTIIYYKGKSDFVTDPVSVQGLTGIWRFLHEQEEITAELQFSPYGGAISTVSESATPFPHREGTRYIIHYYMTWTSNSTSVGAGHISWIRRLYRYMTPYVSKSPRRAYFNYRDLDIGMNNEGNSTSYSQARVWGFKYFKNNFDRLVRVKTMIDPSNFFRNEQSIPPLSSS